MEFRKGHHLPQGEPALALLGGHGFSPCPNARGVFVHDSRRVHAGRRAASRLGILLQFFEFSDQSAANLRWLHRFSWNYLHFCTPRPSGSADSAKTGVFSGKSL